MEEHESADVFNAEMRRDLFSEADDAALDGEGGSVGAVGGSHFVEDDADVQFDGAHAHVQGGDDVFVRMSFDDEAEDSQFALGERLAAFSCFVFGGDLRWKIGVSASDAAQGAE